MKNNLKNKKIVFLLTNEFTHDSRVLKEALSAKKAGMNVWVLARKSRDTKFRETREGIKIIRVQSWVDQLWARISKTKGREIGGSQSGGTKVPKKLVVYIALFNIHLINKLFFREVGKIKPHLIHANDSTSLLAAYKIKKAGYKVVFDAHELYSESVVDPGFLWRLYYVRLEKRIGLLDGMFSVCQSILDELNRRYNTKDLPQEILYNAPTWQEIKYKSFRKPLRILYLGNNGSQRGVLEFIKIVDKVKNITVTAIGSGFPVIAVDNINTFPPVSPDEVVKTAFKFDVGVMPFLGISFNNRFSSPNKLFEYMMAGLAIASSDLPEIRKVVTESQNGVLFNPHKPSDVVKKIKYLIDNPKVLTKFKRNSLNAAKEYCWENQEKKQLKMYKRLLS